MAPVSLKAVDRVEILSVMDNTIDVLMGNTPVAQRHKRGNNAHTVISGNLSENRAASP